jgi:1-acyl-sn-glycerol-3-phosphate acyltransferase
MKTKHNRIILVLRSTVFWIWSISYTLLMGAPVLLGRLISYEFSAKMSVWWLHGNLWGLKHICGITWKVQGRENVPDYPVLVLAKHQSTWETYFIPTLLNRIVYVAKKSLGYIPIFGWALICLNFILIDRRSGRSAVKQMVEQGRERMSNGMSVIIFPEGTRKAVGAKPEYKMGGAIVAEELGVDVLPIAHNAGVFWPRHGYIKWPGEIDIVIGPLIKTKGRKAADILHETQQWIESEVQKMPTSP